MRNRSLLLGVALLGIGLAPACIDDPDDGVVQDAGASDASAGSGGHAGAEAGGSGGKAGTGGSGGKAGAGGSAGAVDEDAGV